MPKEEITGNNLFLLIWQVHKAFQLSSIFKTGNNYLSGKTGNNSLMSKNDKS